jgi:ferric-dicitrate binding protein FerR (iron transport regulator)
MAKGNSEKENKVLNKLSEIFQRYKEGTSNKEDMDIIQKASPIINKGKQYRLNKKETNKVTDELYKNIIERIGSKPLGEDAIRELKGNRFRLFPLSQVWKYAAVAAIIILVASGGYFTFINQYPAGIYPNGQLLSEVSMETSINEMRTETLPDGTVVHLNRETNLSYDRATFNKNRREVRLSGEAFFEVAKNKQKPFFIHYKDLLVHVTGTAFTITSYKEMANTSVWVKNGTVEVSRNQKLLATLTKDKRLVYDEAKQACKTTEEDWNKTAGWLDGKLVFTDANADELKTRLKQFYGVELNIENKAISRVENVNAVFLKEDGIRETMESIALSCNVKYKINGNRITITAD